MIKRKLIYKELMKEVCNKETYILKINIMSACTGEKIGSIIVDKKHSTINEWFNKFMKEKYNDKLYETDIKIIYDLIQIYSYYDQEIGNKSIEKINLFENIQEISVLLVFSDPFIYISDIIINPDGKSYNIESYQNLNDNKKEKINELLNILHNNKYQLGNLDIIDMLYDHIIITKFIAIVLLKKDHCFSELRRNQLNEIFCDDKEIVKIAVFEDGLSLEYASIDLQADREIVTIAVSQNGYALRCASIDLQDDREIVTIAVSKNGLSLKFASIILRADREIVKISVLHCGRALQYASIDLRADKEIVEIAVLEDGRSLQFASLDLRADREIVEIAVLQYGLSLEYASLNLRADREIVKNAVSRNGLRSEIAVSRNGLSLEYVSINSLALEYASINLRNDREIVIIAISENSNALQFASEELQADREIVNIDQKIKRITL